MVQLQCRFKKQNEHYVRVFVDIPIKYFNKVADGEVLQVQSESSTEAPLEVTEEVIEDGSDTDSS